MESIPLLKKKLLTPLRGFTLVEMMVVLIIITLITTVAITSQGAFNRSLVLTDTAYTIAFSIREAQTYGLSSRTASGQSGVGYGIRFSTVTPKSYILFADASPVSPGSTQSGLCPGHTQPSSSPDAHPGDCIYDTAVSAELVRTYTLNRGFNIYKFCGTELATPHATKCSATHFETIHISFMRPSTDTTIFGRSSTGTLTALSDATIYLRSPDGVAERCILVSRVGQISVANCP
jgi:prepilin-type N-terminal cleavage/methylation domain-containing protein